MASKQRMRTTAVSPAAKSIADYFPSTSTVVRSSSSRLSSSPTVPAFFTASFPSSPPTSSPISSSPSLSPTVSSPKRDRSNYDISLVNEDETARVSSSDSESKAPTRIICVDLSDEEDAEPGEKRHRGPTTQQEPPRDESLFEAFQRYTAATPLPPPLSRSAVVQRTTPPRPLPPPIQFGQSQPRMLPAAATARQSPSSWSAPSEPFSSSSFSSARFSSSGFASSTPLSSSGSSFFSSSFSATSRAPYQAQQRAPSSLLLAASYSSGPSSSSSSSSSSSYSSHRPQSQSRTLAHIARSAETQSRGQGKRGRSKQAEARPNLVQLNSLASVPLEMLSVEQRRVYESALTGQSMFISGSAGVGKSFLLLKIIEGLRERQPPSLAHRFVVVTASTGVAALNIRGVTIHSWAGIGLGALPFETLLQQISLKSKVRERWQNIQTLIIDEVSMLSAPIFDLLERLGRSLRGDQRPFGGIQVIACGDFLQLPPVTKGGERRSHCFQAEHWSAVIKHSFLLKEVFRQTNPFFVRMLQEIRVGLMSPAAKDALFERIVVDDPARQATSRNKEEAEAILLYCDNAKVNATNTHRLEQILSDIQVFKALETGNDQYRKMLDAYCLAPLELTLKVGAQVMLLKNLSFEARLVNGSQGIVLGYTPDSPPKGEGDEYSISEAKYWPVKRKNVFALPATFPPGKKLIPAVKFGAQIYAIKEQSWAIPDPGNPAKTLAQRTQIPLRLSWAVTIHKSQGLTLDSIQVDLSNCFETGQMYTALSRVTSLDGLRILGRFNPDTCLRTDPAAISFYEEIIAAQTAPPSFAAPAPSSSLVSEPPGIQVLNRE